MRCVLGKKMGLIAKLKTFCKARWQRFLYADIGPLRDFFYPRCRRCNWAGEMSTNKTFAWNEALDHNRSKCIEPAGEGANANAL